MGICTSAVSDPVSSLRIAALESRDAHCLRFVRFARGFVPSARDRCSGTGEGTRYRRGGVTQLRGSCSAGRYGVLPFAAGDSIGSHAVSLLFRHEAWSGKVAKGGCFCRNREYTRGPLFAGQRGRSARRRGTSLYRANRRRRDGGALDERRARADLVSFGKRPVCARARPLFASAPSPWKVGSSTRLHRWADSRATVG